MPVALGAFLSSPDFHPTATISGGLSGPMKASATENQMRSPMKNLPNIHPKDTFGNLPRSFGPHPPKQMMSPISHTWRICVAPLRPRPSPSASTRSGFLQTPSALNLPASHELLEPAGPTSRRQRRPSVGRWMVNVNAADWSFLGGNRTGRKSDRNCQRT